MAAKSRLHLVAPTTEKQTVASDMARRRPNAELRSRERLTADEVERLIAAAKNGRILHRSGRGVPPRRLSRRPFSATRRLAIGLCAAHGACLKGDYGANPRTPF
jgi:hypothetical protein